MSSKNTPKRVAGMGAPGRSTCTVTVLVCAVASCTWPLRQSTQISAMSLVEEVSGSRDSFISSKQSLIENGEFKTWKCSYCSQTSKPSIGTGCRLLRAGLVASHSSDVKSLVLGTGALCHDASEAPNYRTEER